MDQLKFPRRQVKFKTGEFIFHQNDNSRDLYILKSGNVKIFKTEGTMDIDLDTVGPGQVLGEVSSIDAKPRSASAVASTDTEAIMVPAEEFESILDKLPDRFRKISLILVQRLREVDDRIHLSLEGDKTGHVAAVLSLIASSDECNPTQNGCEVSAKFVENEIMDLLNIPLATINQHLVAFEKKGILKTDRSKITIIDKKELDKLAEPVFAAGGEVPVT